LILIYHRNLCKYSTKLCTAIAHSIREQIYAVAKSLLIINHDFYAESVQDDTFLPEVTTGNVVRDPKLVIEYSPNVVYTSIQEMEKMERDLERENRFDQS
jgi:SWI/SNF-related matrix-associated actin-dependent regulator of chromatin subfamily B protein 1